MTPFGVELPLPVVVLGAVTGVTYGILAVGLVLVYRTNRIVNFAHGEIGAFGAAVLGLMVTAWHLPYWLALPLAIAVAAAVGAGSEVVVIRRLRSAPALMSIVATLGLAQFLLLFSLVVNGEASAGRIFPQPPWLPEFDIGALRVTRAYSGMLLVGPLIVVALVVFLKRSRFGLAMRAAAANPDAARMAGVHAGRMSTGAWALAGAVAAFTAIMVLPTRGIASGAFLGPGLLVRALAAAVIGRMVSLPAALLAGVGIGVVEQLLLWNHPRGGLVEAVLFGMILVALLLQPRRGGREEQKGSWAAVQPWRPLPEAFLRLATIRYLPHGVAALGLAVGVVLPLTSTNETAVILVTIIAFALVGLSLGIVTSLAGQLSLGQFAIAGVGATASYVVTTETGNFFLGFLLAGAAGAAASLVIGLPALRLGGLMLAVTTLGFALASHAWLFNQTWMLGQGIDPGRPIIGDNVIDSGKEYYFVALFVLVVGFWISRNIWRGGIGRRLRAIRDNEDGARAFTVPAVAVKLQGFMLAGFLAGLGGAAYGHSLSRLSATAFPISAGIDVAAMTVLGGVGIIAGPLIGALYIIGVPRFLPLDNAGLAATALGWLILVLYVPGGIAQLVRPLRDRLVDALARRGGLDPARARSESAAEAPAPSLPAVTGRRPALPAAGGPVLEVQRLSKRFGGVRAVDEVSLAVRRGEILGLIGPNGAGKTTLFELIGGFTKPDDGRVLFAGEDVTALAPEARGRLGLIRSFQDAALFPTMTVLEVVQLALERTQPTSFFVSALGWSAPDRRKEARARELLSMMGLHGYRHTSVGALSTGTRRVTELACLVALEPSVLLLDEPASGIAQRETEALGELLVSLQEHLGATFVVIEHDIPMVMSISDRIVAMESGRILALGSPAEVREDPAVIESYLGGDVRAIDRSGAVRVAAAGLDERCRETTRSGRQCSRRARVDGLCVQHAGARVPR